MKLFKLTLFITILMFTFLSKSNANYEKIFYDFEIKLITGQNIKLSDYKGKTILTNLHSDMDYQTLKKKLPQNIYPAYDGLELSLK